MNPHLSEAEEDAQATAQLEGVVDLVLQQGSAGFATAVRLGGVGTALLVDQLARGLIRRRHHGSCARSSGVEAAAFQAVLHLFAHIRGHCHPSLLGELLLLLGIDGQTGTGNGELNQEQHEQNDHVLRRGESKG